MTVCEEDTINDIKAKYSMRNNSHNSSYTWRKKSRDVNCNSIVWLCLYLFFPYVQGNYSGQLVLTKTLSQNGLLLEGIQNGIPPAIWLFYNDDFTIA